jgi:hypothetical protein
MSSRQSEPIAGTGSEPFCGVSGFAFCGVCGYTGRVRGPRQRDCRQRAWHAWLERNVDHREQH